MLVLLFSGSLYAQSKLIDSLLGELSKAETDSARVMLNCSLSKQYALTDAVKSKEYGQAAYDLATAAGFEVGRAKALTLLGNSALVMGDYGKAMEHYFQALALGKQLNDTATLISSYINLGNVYNKIQDSKRAINHYLLATALAQKANDTIRLGSAYNNLGDIYEDQGKYSTALNYYKQATKLQEGAGDKKGWAISLLNIGNIHLHLGQAEHGLPYLFKSVSLNEEIQNDMIKMAALGKIAEIYLATGNKAKALRYAQQSFDMAKKTESTKKIVEASLLMQKVYAALNNYKQSYEYLSIYTKHKEELDNESRARVEAEITAKYEIAQKEQENQRLKAEQEKQAAEIQYQHYTLILEGTIILLMLVLLIVLFLGWQRQRAAYAKLQDAHYLMQTQNAEITAQRNEISTQAKVLQEQNERLGRHDAFKNKVFTIISHDLRGPFYSIKSILGLAQARTLPEADVKRIFNLLGRDMDVAMAMLDNVLIWAKAQLEESCIKVEPVNLHRIAEENMELVRSQANDKGVKLLNYVTPGATALADKERLNFVLRNLLTNAVKFSYPGGQVSFKVEEQADKVVVLVSDNGKGMSPANVANLFSERRFTTLGTSGEKGTGLGLMLCRELLESFSGQISVQSEDGKGSVFAVSLPRTSIEVSHEEVQLEPELA
ncbi:ATP-binding protein [Pontibacter korlensis]